MCGTESVRARGGVYVCRLLGQSLSARAAGCMYVAYGYGYYFLGREGCFRGRSEEERRGDTVAARAKELPDELASQ